MSSRRTTLDDLFSACERGDLPTVRQAVADGLDLKNARQDRYGYYISGYYQYNYTPLHLACGYVCINSTSTSVNTSIWESESSIRLHNL